VILTFALAGASVYFYARKIVAPAHALSRYGPFILPVIYAVIAWLVIMPAQMANPEIHFPIISTLMAAFAPFVLYFMAATIFGIPLFFPLFILAAYAFFGAAFALGAWKSGRPATRGWKSTLGVLVIVLAVAAIPGFQTYTRYQNLLVTDPRYPEQDHDRQEFRMRQQYTPFQLEARNRLPLLRQTPTLQFDQNYPALDGATAFFPIYAAAAQAIYLPGEDQEVRADKVHCSTTPYAYERLIAGETDMIFVLAPSEAHQKLAAEQGLTLTLTPIAKEAFVFLVHDQNPVRDLSLEQVRAIYSGQINHWRAVGGANEKILPFQREKNSGSQTILQREVMRETPLRPPLKKEVMYGMSGLIQAIAQYRNAPNALGYSFRFYATKMNPAPNIRLLAINSIAPTPENIRNGRYPLTVDVYMVTARPRSQNTQQLHDWFLSEQGQQLIEDVGYVPLTPAPEQEK
jgi:phosphate transport system substrate-binding protein